MTDTDGLTRRLPSAAVTRALGLAAVALGAAGIAIGAFSAEHDPQWLVRLSAEAFAVVTLASVGLYATRHAQAERFARLLVLGAIALAPTMLALSAAPAAYSIGRIWAWGLMVWMVYLLLAFPVGRLSTTMERVVVGAGIAVVAIVYLPTALLYAHFPTPTPWSDCTAQCPRNPFAVGSGTTTPEAIEKLRDGLTVVVYLAAAWIVVRRWGARSRIARRIHGPVLVFALVYFLIFVAYGVVRAANPDAAVLTGLGIAAVLAVPLLVLGLFVGLVRWRFVTMTAERQLAPEPSGPGIANKVRDLIAYAISDPSLEVGYWSDDGGGWIDEDGRPFALPARGTRRARTEITSRGQPVALLVHDDVYLAEPALREVVRGVTLMALENQRLQANARASLRELSLSRARIAAGMDKERLRIERDLHDGAQQSLIALKIAAERAASKVTSPQQTSSLFEGIAASADAALDDVRSLARGVYPPLLVDFGLVDALSDAAHRSAVPAVVRARGVERYPQEIEAAVYFCCLEALQNAEKHSRTRSIRITLRGDDGLSFEVLDYGRGFDPDHESDGAGLGNMRDRITAVSGTLRIDSVPGSGVRIAGTVPIVQNHVPAEIERLVLRATDVLEDSLGIYRAIRTASGKVIDFAVEHVNDAACQSLGLTREAQVGKTLGQLRADYVDSETFEWHKAALESTTVLVREEPVYVHTVGGRRLQVSNEVRARGLGSGRLAVVWREVTERRRAEDALRFRAQTVAREGDAICVVRARGDVIVYANSRFDQMLGYEPGSTEGRRASSLGWEEHPITSGEGGHDVRLVRRDGATIWCELVTDGFEDRELGWCWISAYREVTTRKQERERALLESERLRGALRSLPALAYSADRNLQCTLLFDSLVEPGRAVGSEATDHELFGARLAPHVTALNSRVLVTARTATAVTGAVGGEPPIALAAEPVLAEDGTVVGLVGTALERTPAPVAVAAVKLAADEGDRQSSRFRARGQ